MLLLAAGKAPGGLPEALRQPGEEVVDLFPTLADPVGAVPDRERLQLQVLVDRHVGEHGSAAGNEHQPTPDEVFGLGSCHVDPVQPHAT